MATTQKPGHGILKRYILKFLKVIGWIIGIPIVLLIIAFFLIRIPAIQHALTQKAVSYLEKKIGTPVRLERIIIALPKKVVLEGLYLEDQLQDTLLYAREISIDADLIDLLRKKVTLNSVQLESLSAAIRKDSVTDAFNFDYIINAFADSTSIDTTASPWEFSLKNISVNDSKILYHADHQNVNGYFGALSIHIKEFDLKNQVFEFGKIDLSNSRAFFTETPYINQNRGNDSKDSSATHVTLRFNEIILKNIIAEYAQLNQIVHINLGDLKINPKEIDLNKKIIKLKQLEVKNTLASCIILSVDTTQNESQQASKTYESPWTLAANNVVLKNNGIQYYNHGKPIRAGLDLNHLWVFGLDLEAEGLSLENKSAGLNLKHLSFKEKKGLVVKELSLQGSLNNQETKLEKFVLHTGSSSLKLQGQLQYRSLDSLIHQWNDVHVKMEISPSVVSAKDILFLTPAALDSLPLQFHVSDKIQFKASVNGRLNHLAIPMFEMRALDSTFLSIHGTIDGLKDLEKANFNIAVENFYITHSDLRRVLPDSTMPASLECPDWLKIRGEFKGGLSTPNVNAVLISSSGKLEIVGIMNLKDPASYQGDIKTTGLNLGQLLKQKDKMGTLDMKLTIRGSGLRAENINANVDLSVSKFQYNHYDYKGFNLKGSVKKLLFSGNAGISDKNLDFSIKGNIDNTNELRHYQMTLNLRNADFKELNLSERAMKVRGTLDVDLTLHNMQPVNGHVDIRKFAVYNGLELYRVDSLLFVSLDKEGESSITVRSDIVTGDFKGTINLFSLPQVLRQHVNSYFHLQDSSIHTPHDPQNFSFELTLKNTDLLTEIIFPDLEPFVPGIIRGNFDSEAQKLDLSIGLSKIRYANVGTDSIVVRLTSDKKSMNYRFALRNLQVDTFRIEEISLTGKIAHDSILTALNIRDSLAKEKYLLGGIIHSKKNNFEFHFIPKQVILNYNEWQVPADNFIEFGRKSFIAHRIDIAKEGEKISFITTDSVMDLSFQNLELENITRIVSGIIPAGGKLNGNLKLTTGRRGEFNSKLQIQHLAILQKPWGDLTLGLTYSGHAYTLDAQVNGQHQQIQAKGLYTKKDSGNELDITLDLSPLNLEVVEPFSMGALKNVKGGLRGKVKLQGNPIPSSVRGTLTFSDASFTIKDLNSPFTLKNESITFNESGIDFSHLTILDGAGNSATLQGAVRTKVYKDFDLDLRLVTKNFLLMDTHESNDALGYGKLKVNLDTRVSGNLKSPKVNGKISLSDDTNITYVVPQAEKNVMQQKGIVTFVDKDAYKDPFLANIKPVLESDSSFPPIDLTANLELSGKEILNIVIDPITKDKLTVQGRANLTLDMTAAGNMNLSGRYEIVKGSYNLSFYKIVKREFKILHGSSIAWSGDIYNAALDIRASYTTEASPLDLLSNQITTASQAELTSYQQRIPFLVYLYIKGQIAAPDISFKLDMPDDKKNTFSGAVYAKIQDINTRETDLDKQVFSLLILGRFMSDNPFESSAGTDLSNTARTSVSRLLSEQLNRLSKNVNGIELSLDVKSYEDYTNGTAQGKTAAQLGVSKSLFSNRLVVKLSGNVDLESEEQTQHSATDYIGDLALEYKLTKDGRFRVTGFRQSNYEMIDGELIETGAGLIYIKDYNTLKELFKANEKKK